MKRIRDFERYLCNQRRIAKRSARARARKRSKRGIARIVTWQPPTREVIELTPPVVFSLIENPESTLPFFSKFDLARNSHDEIFINLDSVEHLTIDTLVLLISKMKDKSNRRCKTIGGSIPSNEKVRAVLAESGFYSHLSAPPEGFDPKQNNGFFTKHVGKKVRQDVCDQVVKFATSRIHGKEKKNGGFYRALVECMANTKDHATNRSDRPQSWWLSVYYDQSKAISYVAFLDCGVGVFKSARMLGILKQLGQFLGILSYVDLLNDVLDSKIGSRTGQAYRGKGLPSIKRALERGQIHNLKILTNTALLDVSTRKGKILPHAFRGTCLTWEIHCER